MSIIEIRALEQKLQHITVHEEPAALTNSEWARKYRTEAEEAKAAGRNEIEVQALVDISQEMSRRALLEAVQEYRGKKAPSSR